MRKVKHELETILSADHVFLVEKGKMDVNGNRLWKVVVLDIKTMHHVGTYSVQAYNEHQAVMTLEGVI